MNKTMHGQRAVVRNVCSADLNLAMERGVNYPIAPLEWADAIGRLLRCPCAVLRRTAAPF